MQEPVLPVYRHPSHFTLQPRSSSLNKKYKNEEEINNELDALSDQIGKVNYNRPSMDYRLEKLEGKRKDFLDAIAYVTKEEIPSMEQLYKSEGIHEVNIAFIQNGLDTIEDNEKEAIIKGLEGKRDQPRVVQKPKALNPVSEEDKEYLRWYLTWCRENKQVHSTCPDWNNSTKYILNRKNEESYKNGMVS